MPRRKLHEEEDKLDRWLVSYADFITLLFAFFVVMYSMSSINEGKYRVLSDTMVAAFNTPPRSAEPIQIGEQAKTIKKQQKMVQKINPVTIKPVKTDTAEKHMAKIAKKVSDALKPLVDKKLIKIDSDKLWVEVEMNNKILFDIGTAELEYEALLVLKDLAKVLATLPNYIDVEGHTDNIPIKNKIYPTNWELSAARAASVVRALSKFGVNPRHLTVLGYGKYRPKQSNKTFNGRQRNRRVVVVILADKNVRRMMEIEKTSQTGSQPGSQSGIIQ